MGFTLELTTGVTCFFFLGTGFFIGRPDYPTPYVFVTRLFLSLLRFLGY